MMALTDYIAEFDLSFNTSGNRAPWDLIRDAQDIIVEKISMLGPDYKIFNRVAIHKTVSIDSHAILKGPAIISKGCFIGAHAYLRGGVYLDENVSIGPGCEVKTSFIFSRTALGHFNFVGDSILGSNVNMEAGSVIANHYNERKNKSITVVIHGKKHPTGLEKFGALVGDHCKIGANAVLSPGTIIPPHTIVKRLQLIDQNEAETLS